VLSAVYSPAMNVSDDHLERLHLAAGGADVTMVTFEDLQCSDSAHAHPIVNEVAATRNVAVVRHDFLHQQHDWAHRAAVIARYFDAQAGTLGGSFRMYIYENQPAITAENLNSYAERFAESHGTAMPFVLDPGRKLEAEVKVDYALAKLVGVQHTPTIWVVGAIDHASSGPLVEAVDRSRLMQMVDDVRTTMEGK
jgi:protein-disulfide isomerase